MSQSSAGLVLTLGGDHLARGFRQLDDDEDDYGGEENDEDGDVDDNDDDIKENDSNLNLSPRLPGRLRLCSHRPLQLLGHPHVLHLENVDQVQGQDEMMLVMVKAKIKILLVRVNLVGFPATSQVPVRPSP